MLYIVLVASIALLISAIGLGVGLHLASTKSRYSIPTIDKNALAVGLCAGFCAASIIAIVTSAVVYSSRIATSYEASYVQNIRIQSTTGTVFSKHLSTKSPCHVDLSFNTSSKKLTIGGTNKLATPASLATYCKLK